MTYLQSDNFFLGLFGYGVSTEITVKMIHPLQSCIYIAFHFTVAILPSGKSPTRSTKVSVLKNIIRNTE